MATVSPSNYHLARKELTPASAPADDSLARMLSGLCQQILGVLLVLLGMALVSTLLLMPIGVPLALVGAALVASASSP